MVPFGQAVLLWRLEKGLSQEQLARSAGIPRPNLSGIERGKREVSLKTIRALALALDVRPGTLVDGVSPTEGLQEFVSSRAAMERIANAVAKDKPLSNPQEREIAEHLKQLLQSRLRALGLKKGRSRLSRKSDRAWLALSSLSPAVLQSLLERAVERSQSQ